MRSRHERKGGARSSHEGMPAALVESRESAVLALQRSAGNAAVNRLLRRASPRLLQRDRGLPAEPRSLADVAAVASEMTIETDVIALGQPGQYFKGGRGQDREGIAVEVRFAGDMAAKGADAKTEKKVRDGLGNIAVAIFNLHSATTEQPHADVTYIRDLELTSLGGQDGRYRFTSVARKWAKKKGKKWPSEVDVIVELLGRRRPELKSWSSLDASRRLDLENRFSRLGYTQAQPGLNTGAVDTWSKDQFGMVLQALEYVPEDVLRGVPDIVWERGHGKRAPTGEPADYTYKTNPVVRRMTVYDDAFGSDDVLIRLIAHEVGHAVSFKPAEKGGASAALALSAGYQKAAKADSPRAVTAYGAKNWHEHYAESYSMFIAEPDTMKTLRPKLFDWFTKQQAAAAPPKPPVAKPSPAKPAPGPKKP